MFDKTSRERERERERERVCISVRVNTYRKKRNRCYQFPEWSKHSNLVLVCDDV